LARDQRLVDTLDLEANNVGLTRVLFSRPLLRGFLGETEVVDQLLERLGVGSGGVSDRLRAILCEARHAADESAVS